MAARRRVAWARSAQEALDEIIAYVAERSIQNARSVLERTLQAAGELEEFPDRGRVVPEFRNESIREVFVDGFRVMYEVGDDKVTVVAFVHGARDFSKWRAELR